MTLSSDTPASSPPPNPEQELIAAHGHGPIHIMAGAGTGKTHALTARVVALIAAGLARPDQIVALTFTDKAAAEMRERIGDACLQMSVPPETAPVTVLTYHSFGNSVIAEWGGLIGLPPSPPLLSEAECWLLLWECLPRIDFRSISLMHLRSSYGSPMRKILELGSRLKDELATPGQVFDFLADGGDDDEQRAELADYARALEVYGAEQIARGVVDYGDQIARAVEALRLPEVRAAYQERYRFVLVDEYQDTNYAQSVMVQLLVQDWPQHNVCVVGDVRQAIYRFRGAAPDNLLRFQREFPAATPYSLRRNYRSTQQILDAANAVWADTPDEQQDDLISVDDRQGAPVVSCVCQDPESEWEWLAGRIRDEHDRGVAYSDMAALVRKNAMKTELAQGLMERGIPAVASGGTDLLETPEVRELLSYLRALSRPSDSVSLAHIASSDSFGLDEAALYDLIGPLPDGESLFDNLVRRAADPTAPDNLRLFLETFRRLLATSATASPPRIVEQIIGLRRGSYTNLQQTNVYRFHALAADFSSGRVPGASLGGFVAYLNLLIAAPPDQEAATDVLDEDAVQVLTVHAAKGLERRVIFVATASQQDFTLRNQADLLPLSLRHAEADMPRSEDFPEEKRFKKELDGWLKAQYLLEERRIAYVALTRARDQLYISWHRLPLHRGKERASLDVLQHILPMTVQERFDRPDWEASQISAMAPNLVEAARRFARRQANIWAGWKPEDFDGDGSDLAKKLRTAWDEYWAGGGTPDGGDILRLGMGRWRAERQRVESLLARCLTPAARPQDADLRPLVEVPTTLSYSMLSSYLDCSRKAYLHFIAGFPGEPNPNSTAAGIAFHAAVEFDATEHQAGRQATLDELLDAYRASAAEAHGENKHTVGGSEREMLQYFRNSPDHLATPLHIEAEFYWRVGPGYLHGFVDRIQRCPDGTIELIDFKTSHRALSEAEARESLQLLIYALASREVFAISPNRLTFVYPRLSKRVSVAFNDEELCAARRRIVDLMERARTLSYDEVNTSHCPMCEYRLICPAAAQSARPAP
ncbi:MAG: ATP-dependent helicase [Chloroflexota bacterium]